MSIHAQLATQGEELPSLDVSPLPPLEHISSRLGAHHAARESFAGPTARSNWVIPDRLLCGGAPHDDLRELVRAGISCFVSLQAKGEACPYRDGVLKLNASVVFESQPITDQSVTADSLLIGIAVRIIRRIHDGHCVYVHCKGGHGRTGTVCAIILGLVHGIDGPQALVTYQALHDSRRQPTFAAHGYEPTDDGSSCIALFPVQRQQVLRLLGSKTAAKEVVEAETTNNGQGPAECPLSPSRLLSDEYGRGASKYDEVVLLKSKELGKAAAIAAKNGDWEAAADCFQRIVNLRPDWTKAKRCLEQSKKRAAKSALLLAPGEEATSSPSHGDNERQAVSDSRTRGEVRGNAKPCQKRPSLVVLVGLPGSGKSTFSRALARSSEDWTVISQDELGSRAAFENALVAALKVKGTRVIADRCNVRKEDRKRIFDLCFNPAGAVAIHFDVDQEKCCRRVAGRTDHPSISFGRGGAVVEDFAKAFEPPTIKEGFSAVHRVNETSSASLLQQWGAEPPEIAPLGFFKFPRTRHVLNTGGTAVTRDDLVMDNADAAAFFDGKTVVIAEEKVDGANLGLSLNANYEIQAQNRSHFVNFESHPQFRPLSGWIEEHSWALCQLLKPEDEVLFGEWCYAKHSVAYTTLPGYFVAFDIYNKRTGKFASVSERNRRLEGLDIPIVRCLAERPFNNKDDLLQLLETKSAYGTGFVEGAYLRIDSDDGNVRRGKIVRPDFIQGITEHWMSKEVVRQGVRPDLWQEGERILECE